MPPPHDDAGLVRIIDLSQPDDVIVPLLRQACLAPGFFHVVNHGVPSELISDVFQSSASFFALPHDEKAECKVNQWSRGWTPLGEETLDPGVQSTGDTKEGFYIGREVGPDEQSLPLHGPNNWPKSERLAGWKAVMMNYHQACSSLGQRLVRLLALTLSLPHDHFEPFFDRPMATLRLLHYDQTISDTAAGIFACGAHTDYGMITLSDHVRPWGI